MRSRLSHSWDDFFYQNFFPKNIQSIDDILTEEYLKKIDKNQYLLGSFLIKNNINNNFNLQDNHIKKIIKYSDFKYQDKDGYSLSMYFMKYNKDSEFLLKKTVIKDIINQSDFLQQEINGLNLLFFLIYYNKSQRLFLSNGDFIEFIKQSDLGQSTFYVHTIASYLMFLEKNKIIFLNKKILLEIFNSLDFNNMSQKNRNIIAYLLFSNGSGLLSKEDKKELYYKYFRYNVFFNLTGDWVFSFLGSEYLCCYFKDCLIFRVKNNKKIYSRELIRKILITDDTEIIQSVYQHISSIHWDTVSLLLFLQKNNLSINRKIANLIG